MTSGLKGSSDSSESDSLLQWWCPDTGLLPPSTVLLQQHLIDGRRERHRPAALAGQGPCCCPWLCHQLLSHQNAPLLANYGRIEAPSWPLPSAAWDYPLPWATLTCQSEPTAVDSLAAAVKCVPLIPSPGDRHLALPIGW